MLKLAFQISFAYSAMVRSLEHFLEAATFRGGRGDFHHRARRWAPPPSRVNGHLDKRSVPAGGGGERRKSLF
jgi:hypothetical protein